MECIFLCLLGLLLGIAVGALACSLVYRRELVRGARWLAEREPQGNARMTLGTSAPGLADMASAVNGELDRVAAERVQAIRRTQEFQRDLASLSHDIRTPLMGAKGYLQLARDEADVAQRNRHLAAAAARIDGTTALLDQLFAYTKATDPDLALHLHDTELLPAVERALLAHYPEFESRGWEPKVTFDDPDACLPADAEALGRVLENLVVNALHHGSSAPRICQRGHALSISNEVENPDGIEVDRLFERFYQADAARSGGGSGLGLTTASKLAEAMGMRLSAHLTANILTIALSW